MAEAAKKDVPTAKETPKGVPTKDPNAKNVAPKVEKELTPEEKKVQAEYAKLEEEATSKVAKINQNLAREDSASRIHYQIRNGEIVYMWVNTVPTRMLTEDELKAVAEMR